MPELRLAEHEIYVFLYQNLKKSAADYTVINTAIYVFLYQNLKIEKDGTGELIAFEFMYFYIRI